MSIHKADDFIKRAVIDKDFRKQCYSYKSQEELTEKENFTIEEFENALNALLFKCQSYDQAEVLRQIQMWFSMFSHKPKE